MPGGLTTASHRATGATRAERPRRASRRGPRRGRPVHRGLFERPGHLPFRGSVRERDGGVRVAEPFADPLSHFAVSDRGVRVPRQQGVDGRGIQGLGPARRRHAQGELRGRRGEGCQPGGVRRPTVPEDHRAGRVPETGVRSRERRRWRSALGRDSTRLLLRPPGEARRTPYGRERRAEDRPAYVPLRDGPQPLRGRPPLDHRGQAADEELPKEIEVGGGEDLRCRAAVDSRPQRIADHELSQPSAPQVCSPDGTPAADLVDVPTPGSQPTDFYPTNLYPTPDHSFDFDGVLRSPTP